MKSGILFWIAGFLMIASARASEQKTTDLPLNRAIAATPNNVSVTIPQTGTALDGGSILNDIRFSDGRLYRLQLDTPFAISTDELIHEEIHFTIFNLPDRSQSEVLEHASAAEERLVQLLESLMVTTKDPHEKKNAISLVRFLRDRKQPFPMGRKWWDFTPWEVDWNRIKSPTPSGSPAR